MNYYERLNVESNATYEEIRRAYARKSKLLHPDTHLGETEDLQREAKNEQQQLNAAWETLKDPDKRRRYDEGLRGASSRAQRQADPEQTDKHQQSWWSPTHVAPPEGLRAWGAPDPSSPVIDGLRPGVPIRVVEVRGAWARVICSNGWTAWVDGRILGVTRDTLPPFPDQQGSTPPEQEPVLGADDYFRHGPTTILGQKGWVLHDSERNKSRKFRWKWRSEEWWVGQDQTVLALVRQRIPVPLGAAVRGDSLDFLPPNSTWVYWRDYLLPRYARDGVPLLCTTSEPWDRGVTGMLCRVVSSGPQIEFFGVLPVVIENLFRCHEYAFPKHLYYWARVAEIQRATPPKAQSLLRQYRQELTLQRGDRIARSAPANLGG